MRKRLTAAIAAVLVLTGTATACGTDGDKEPQKTVTVTETTNPEVDGEAPADMVEGAEESRDDQPKGLKKKGETVSLEGLDGTADITLLEVKDPAPYDTELDDVKSTERVVAIKMQVKNTAAVAYDDSPSNGMRVSDTDGQWYDTGWVTTTAGPDLGSPRLMPGDRAVGWETFTVPKTAKLEKLQFVLDSGFADEAAEWSLK